ncbi:DUF459 domain-containing protein [Rhizobium sp. L1K21]|uniref:SGNH/GDSL hydrolase family protein n=1 Tax=Rhizobium sp. L1K21 TaxID=2954933 RepID=UPI002093DD2A|nr:DUF459 domain-containing protein [Rhizobium sp. L1K21]MCO6185029.1 DUF459 domain-containing protein [Rhizobium sp. L1K21]
MTFYVIEDLDIATGNRAERTRRMKFWRFLSVQKHAATIAVAALACLYLAATVSSAAAQEQKRKPQTLIELLFGNKGKKEPPPKKTRVKPQRSVSRSAPQAVEVPEKVEHAKTVLVVGDFMAGTLAKGLEEAFETSPGIVIDNRTKGSSGLVRQDYYDWPVEFPKLLDEVEPAVAVISVGANDRQEMSVDGNTYSFRTPEWTTNYEARIKTIMTAAKQRNIPLLWTGLPSFRSNAFTADMVTLNSIYRKWSEKNDATYVDIWDGFVDEEGKFAYSGSDIDGQQVRLRTSDGLGFTSSGRRKQAFYVERFIRRILGDATSENFTGIPLSNLPDLQFFTPANNPELVRTDPISITDPAFDGSDTLLGGPAPELAATSPLRRLLENGYTGPVTEGRADYYKPQALQTVEPEDVATPKQ